MSTPRDDGSVGSIGAGKLSIAPGQLNIVSSMHRVPLAASSQAVAQRAAAAGVDFDAKFASAPGPAHASNIDVWDRIRLREARTVAEINVLNAQIELDETQGVDRRAAAALGRERKTDEEEEEEDDNGMDLIEMEAEGEEADGASAGAAELEEHARNSGYYDAVPAARPKPNVKRKAAASSSSAAAAASSSSAYIMHPSNSEPGGPASISLNQVAALIFANDLKPEDIAAWDAIGVLMEAARGAVFALGSHVSKKGQIIRVAETVPAFADENHRLVKLPESVSRAGLLDKEQSLEAQSKLIGTYLSQSIKNLELAEEALYKTARVQHELRHYRKKYAAQQEMEEDKSRAKVEQLASDAQRKMARSGAYYERQVGQAEKRKKVPTDEGPRKSRFAK